jgi:cysteine desulfurase family protein
MIYFDQCSTSYPKAPGVAEQVYEAIKTGCFNINRGGYAGALSTGETVFDTRERLSRLFGAPKSRNVILTGGITQSLNMILKGLLKPGDHVVTTQMEHNGVLRPLTQLKATGVEVDIAACTSEGELIMEDFLSKLRPDTKLVVTTHASNVCGAVLPIREIGAICRQRGILYVVDSAQTAGVLPIHMQNDYIDVLAFAGHKSLLATQGIGGFVITDEAARHMMPLLSGGTGSFSSSLEVPEHLPDRFEAGTLNLPGIVALRAALTYIEETGPQNIHAAAHGLFSRFISEAKGIPGLRLVGPSHLENRCPVAALDFTELDNGEVAYRLDETYGIMTRSGLHCAPLAHQALGTFPKGVVRCSFGHTNTQEEVDVLLSALREITRSA